MLVSYSFKDKFKPILKSSTEDTDIVDISPAKRDKLKPILKRSTEDTDIVDISPAKKKKLTFKHFIQTIWNFGVFFQEM